MIPNWKGTEGSPGRRQSYIWVESISLQVLGSRKGEKFWKCWLLFGRRKENHPHMSGRVFAHSRPHIVLCSWRRLGRRRWFADLWTSWAKETPILSDTVCLWNYAQEHIFIWRRWDCIGGSRHTLGQNIITLIYPKLHISLKLTRLK